MLVLPDQFRFIIYNKDLGVDIDVQSNGGNEYVQVDYKLASGDGSGNASHNTSVLATYTSADLASGNFATFGSTSSVDEFQLWGTFTFATDDGSASGDVILALEQAVDATSNSDWPSATSDFDVELDAYILKSMNISGATTREANISFP